MSKKKKIIIISVICAALIIGVIAAAFLMRGSDTNDLYESFGEDEQYVLEKNGAKEYSSPVLIIHSEDKLIGVTQLGNKVYLDNPDNISVEQGSVASRVQITVGDDGVRRGTLCYPYSTNVNLPVYDLQSKAPEKMADMRIKRLMHSPGSASITDYKINSVTQDQVLSGEKGTAVIHFTVNCDIKPSKFVEAYGEPDGDGWCRGLEYNYSIWGTNETWYMLGEDPIDDLTGNYSESSTRVIEQTQLFVNDEMALGYACFKSPEQSILTDAPLVEMEEEEAGEDYEEIITYYTQLFAVDMNGNITIIEEGMQNLQYNFITESNGKVYLNTTKWASEGESEASHIVCYDINNMRVTRIMDRGVILGITEDTLYAYGSNTVNGVYRPQDIYSIDLATGNIKWATEPVMYATYDNAFIEQGVYDGYLYVMYSKDKLVFKLSEQTGEWSFHYAG